MRLLFRILCLLVVATEAAATPAPRLPGWAAPAVVPAELPRLLVRRVPAGVLVSYSQAPIVIPPVPLVAPPAAPLRASRNRVLQARNGAATIAWLQAHAWIKTWANNRSKEIDQWAREAGVVLASEWCGLTQMQAQKAHKLPYPSGPGGSYNWFKPGPRLVYEAGKKGILDSVKAGHKTGLYNTRKGRIAHIMAVATIVKNPQRGRPPRGFYTWAGNEGSGAKEGIHLTFYPAVNIHAAANWNY